MNKSIITFTSQRSIELYEFKMPSGKHHIHVVLGKICDIYYRGYHLSQYLDLWHGWVMIDKALVRLDKKCASYIRWLHGKSERKTDLFTFTLKFSNPIDGSLVKLIRRYDVTMSLIDALVSEGKWDEQKANRQARNIANDIKGIFRFFMQMGLNKTHLLNKDDKPYFQLAKRSGIMPDHNRFGFGARPSIKVVRKKRRVLPSQNSCKDT